MPVVVYRLGDLSKTETNSAPVTLFNVRETHNHFQEQVEAHFISLGTRLDQDTQTFSICMTPAIRSNSGGRK